MSVTNFRFDETVSEKVVGGDLKNISWKFEIIWSSQSKVMIKIVDKSTARRRVIYQIRTVHWKVCYKFLIWTYTMNGKVTWNSFTNMSLKFEIIWLLWSKVMFKLVAKSSAHRSFGYRFPVIKRRINAITLYISSKSIEKNVGNNLNNVSWKINMIKSEDLRITLRFDENFINSSFKSAW